MIRILKKIEETQILELLSDSDIWRTHEEKSPRIEKLFTDVNVEGRKYRLYLHYNHPCTDLEAQYHAHPHNLALHVIDGIYEMGIGTEFRSPYAESFPFHSTLCKIECYGGMYYEMTDNKGYHYVIPREGKTRAIMVHDNPKDIIVTNELSEERKEKIRKWFYKYYHRMHTLS